MRALFVVMLSVVVMTMLAQAPTVAVIDISAEDAIYEDVSRKLAQSLSEALTKDGVTAVRVEEAELPPEGCRLGPCLGVVARAKEAKAVVTLDAEELSTTKTRVVVTMMRATNGEPLAGGRYELKAGAKKAPAGLTKFLEAAKKAATKL